MSVMSERPAVHDERLAVPLRWWALATMFLASILLAFLVSTPWWVALVSTGVLVAVVVATFLAYGAARVSVRDGVLTAGRAHIELGHVGHAEVLDAEGTRRVAGREADARAYLLLRPYLRRSVRVTITDPADPAPYWLVSTRRPDRLAGALEQARGASTEPRAG
jgi:hypothetical protein